MGEVRVPLRNLASGKAFDGWVRVRNCRGCDDASGELRFKVTRAALARLLHSHACRSLISFRCSHLIFLSMWRYASLSRASLLASSRIARHH